METVKLKLQRIAKKESYTIGKLYVNGEYFCDTLEDPIRNLVDNNNDGDFNDEGEGKIWGQTAILNGEYEILYTFSPKFKKLMPVLVGVKGFSGIRIHAGNSANDTHGCILCGKNKIKGGLVDSRITCDKLYTLIKSAKDANKKVIITII